MRKICALLAFALVAGLLLSFVPQPVSAMTGSGTAEDPYMIYDVDDLQDIQNDLSAYYELANDIDASATATWNWDAGRGVYEGFVPIGYPLDNFTGQLNGNFYTIDGLYMDIQDTSTDNVGVGLFSEIGGAAVVRNLFITNADITVDKSGGECTIFVGILTGNIESSGISDVSTTGNLDVDWASPSSIVNGVGGLAGAGHYGDITRCCSYANVDFKDSTGQAPIAVGGLIGYWDGEDLSDCFARGTVYGWSTSSYSSCGGLIGRQHEASSYTSYSTGEVSAYFPYSSRLGGFMGSKYTGYCSNCFWDLQTSGLASSACGTGKNTAEMKTESTFTDAGWDFDTVWTIGPTVNDGYPYLFWWYDPPEMISDANQVVWFQPNAIIEGTTLPNRAQNGTLIDGEIHWGANPAGITISHGELVPEEEYEFEPVVPVSPDIIKPEPASPTTDVDTARLVNNPLYPLVQIISSVPGFTERLVWLGLAWLIVIGAMLLVHLGFDTRKGTEKPQHFVLTTITGLGLSILFYTMGIFPLWVVILMAFGLVGAIIWERQPVM